MTTMLRELFPEEISDEAASYLVNFFYDLALAFESMHLGKILRHQKSVMESNSRPNKVKKTELTDPPF